MRDLKYKKDELILITSGEYSDYMHDGLFKVLIDFDASDLIEQWAVSNAKLTECYDGIIDKIKVYNQKREGSICFQSWLERNGYIKIIEYSELHTGCWGDITLSSRN